MSDRAFEEKYGPIALVTGASSGIGKSFAEALAAKGIGLVLVARRIELLETLAARLQSEHGVTVKICPIDLAEPGAAERILEATASLDIGLLISNAGYGFKGGLASQDRSALSEMLRVNCDIPMALANGFIPRLRKRGKGGILLTSSVEGLIGCPFSAAYSASKAFVKSLAEALWGELTPEGIDVLAICPGATATEALARSGVDPATMPHVMLPEQVAALALDNLANGPVLVTSEYYKAMFEKLLAMPRRDALTAMAFGMRPIGETP